MINIIRGIVTYIFFLTLCYVTLSNIFYLFVEFRNNTTCAIISFISALLVSKIVKVNF